MPSDDDVLAELGVDDLAEGVLDLFVGGHRLIVADGETRALEKANAAPEGTAPAEGGEILHWRRVWGRQPYPGPGSPHRPGGSGSGRGAPGRAGRLRTTLAIDATRFTIDSAWS